MITAMHITLGDLSFDALQPAPKAVSRSCCCTAGPNLPIAGA
jgi:hypothetical protein